DNTMGQAWTALTGGGAVVLEGQAGIGKTAVLRAIQQRARARGWTVLSCAPAETETALPYAALADLLHPLADRVTALPPPQRAAVEMVLLAAEPQQPVDERTVAAATRALLASAADGDLLVTVDDAPRLDPASRAALAVEV